MQSKTWFCNGTIIRKNLTRGWPIWAAYLAIWMLVMPLAISTSYNFPGRDMIEYADNILSFASMGGAGGSAVYALLTAMVLFSYLYNSRTINTMAALPISRETMLGSHVVTGLLVSVVPNLIVALTTLAVFAVNGYNALEVTFQWFAIVTLNYLFFFGFAIFCASLVGHILALVGLNVVLNFTAAVLNFVTLTLISPHVYGMSTYVHTSRLSLQKISPAFYLLSDNFVERVYEETAMGRVPVDAIYTNWTYLIIVAVCGIAFALLGGYFLQKRHMETAGDVIAVKPLRPAFKYLFALGCSLVLGWFFDLVLFSDTSLWSTLGCTVAGGFVGYFLAEIMLAKSFKVWKKKNFLGYGTLVAFLVLGALAIRLDVTGYEKALPDVDDVASVVLDDYVRWGNYNESEQVTDPDFICDVLAFHSRMIQEKDQTKAEYETAYTGKTITIIYTTKSGQTLQRVYFVPYNLDDLDQETSKIYQMGQLWNDPILIMMRNNVPWDTSTVKAFAGGRITYGEEVYDAQGNWVADNTAQVELTAQEVCDLYNNCIVPDIMDGNLDYDTTYKTYYAETAAGGQTEIQIHFYYQSDGPQVEVMDSDMAKAYDTETTSRRFTVFDDALRTAAFLEQRDIPIYQTEKTNPHQ